jgi:hypothetical protein
MTDVPSGGGGGPSQYAAEIGAAVGIAIFALIGIIGSLQVGIGWAAEGPQAGFFPFYVCVIILISCGVNLAAVVSRQGRRALFAEWTQLRQVLAVVTPTTAYVLLVPYTGIYVASALLIAVFMRWFGRYNWLVVAVLSIGLPIIIFFVFERWFLVPLPKGPVEDFFGY